MQLPLVKLGLQGRTMSAATRHAPQFTMLVPADSLPYVDVSLELLANLLSRYRLQHDMHVRRTDDGCFPKDRS